MNWRHDAVGFKPETKQQCIALAFLFAIETAMRAGEICALQEGDVQGTVARLRRTKNGFPRTVLLDQLVTGPMSAQSVDAVMRQFKKAILERALGAEMPHHLGYAPGDDKPAGTANRTGCLRLTWSTADASYLPQYGRVLQHDPH